MVKNLFVSAGEAVDVGSVPGSERCPAEGNGNPLQYSCLENPIERGALWATVHEVTKSDMTEVTQHINLGSKTPLQVWGSQHRGILALRWVIQF